MGDREKKDAVIDGVGGGAEKEKEKEELEGLGGEKRVVLDFDMLCSTVALQTHGFIGGTKAVAGDESDENYGYGCGGEGEELEFGGLQRLWEGGVLDCFDDHRIAFQSTCCPCYRFGKNMGRAGFGSCFLQGTTYIILSGIALVSYMMYAVTSRHSFLYLAVAFTVTLATYMGLFRTQIRKQFNIRGSNSSIDDCLQHLVCPCCTLCQESRTLEINNVQDGVWRGRGDTICIGGYGEGAKSFIALHHSSLTPTKSPDFLSMERPVLSSENHSWTVDASQKEPLVPPSQ